MAEESPKTEYKFLAIRDWDKYQCKDRKGRNIRLYIKDYCHKDVDDPDYNRLTMVQRYLWDAISRLRGRSGMNLRNDPVWIARALGVGNKERTCLPHNVHVLVTCGFLVPTNQQVGFSDSDPDSDSDTETETKGANAPQSPLPPVERHVPSKQEAEEQKQKQHQNHPSPILPPNAYLPKGWLGDDIDNWSEPIPGCDLPPSRIRDCVIFQRYVKRNDYFIKRLTKGYVLQQWKRLDTDTPEDFVWDFDPMWETVEKHLDGMDEPPTKLTLLRRDPKTPEERQQLRDKRPDLPLPVVKALYRKDCPYRCTEGMISVSDYPDNPALRLLEHTEVCRCVYE